MPTGFICGPVHIVEREVEAKATFDRAIAKAAKPGNVISIESDESGVRVQGYLEVEYTVVNDPKLLPSI